MRKLKQAIGPCHPHWPRHSFIAVVTEFIVTPRWHAHSAVQDRDSDAWRLLGDKFSLQAAKMPARDIYA